MGIREMRIGKSIKVYTMNFSNYRNSRKVIHTYNIILKYTNLVKHDKRSCLGPDHLESTIFEIID